MVMKYIFLVIAFVICVINIAKCDQINTEADEVQIENGSYILSGNAKVTEGEKTFTADKIKTIPDGETQKIIATGNVQYTEPNITITSNQCISKNDIIEFSGNAILNKKDLGESKSDKIIYNTKDKKVRIEMNGDSIEKVKLNLNEKSK